MSESMTLDETIALYAALVSHGFTDNRIQYASALHWLTTLKSLVEELTPGSGQRGTQRPQRIPLGKVRDLSKEKFGRLTPLYRVGGKTKIRWLCRCDCGTERVVTASGLRTGNSTSCGCSRKDHGHAPHSGTSREYNTWHSMLVRCYDPKNHAWRYYGGRGISVCDEWRADFLAFYRDMGPRPPGRTLDRIDCDGHYEKANCRWATPAEQRRNQRVRLYSERRRAS